MPAGSQAGHHYHRHKYVFDQLLISNYCLKAAHSRFSQHGTTKAEAFIIITRCRPLVESWTNKVIFTKNEREREREWAKAFDLPFEIINVITQTAEAIINVTRLLRLWHACYEKWTSKSSLSCSFRKCATMFKKKTDRQTNRYCKQMHIINQSLEGKKMLFNCQSILS